MRYIGIDVLRGLSVIGMVIFHAHYLLERVFLIDIYLFPDIFWTLLGMTVATTFIVVSGFSLFLSESRWDLLSWKKSLKRSGILALIALSISGVTYIFFPEQLILWGIIHFFALVSLISPLIRHIGRYTGCISIGVILLWYSFPMYTSHIWFFIPFWWIPEGFYSADYYPLIPWVGYYLLGYSFASYVSLYGRLSLFDWKKSLFSRFFGYIGQNALFIYILHVPLLYISYCIFT